MRTTVLRLAAMAGLAIAAAACANRTGDQTIAEYCSDPARSDYDLCKQHRDIEVVDGRANDAHRVARDARSRADRAQATADQAMARNLACTTQVVHSSQTGSCETPGYVLTSCVQTRFTRKAGRTAILRSINDNQCRFGARVLEMQVRCCRVGSGAPRVT